MQIYPLSAIYIFLRESIIFKAFDCITFNMIFPMNKPLVHPSDVYVSPSDD